MPAGGQQFAEMAAEEEPPPTPQAAPVQPEVPPVVRQQTPVAAAAPEDRTVLLERFLHLRPPTFVGDRDPDRAESWVHELERTFETMDCAELDQVCLAVYQLKGSAHEWWRAVRLTRFQGRRLEQISWQQFLEAFLGEYLPDYACRERRDLFHELVQGDSTVGQYHQSGESYGPRAGVSVSAVAEWRFREIFSVPAPRRQSGECVFFFLFLFGNRRCWPDHEVEEVVHSWRQASLAAAEASDLAVSSGAVPPAGSRAEPAGFGLLPLRAGGALQARVSVEAATGAAPTGTQAQYRPSQPPQCQQQYQVTAVLTVRPWIFQQVLEAQSADEDLADVLQLPEVDLTVEQGIATCPMSPSGLLKATGPMSPSYVQRVKCSGRKHKPQFAPLLCASLISGELKLGSSVEAWEELVDHLASFDCSVVEALKKGASVCCTLVRLHSSSLRGVARRRARNSTQATSHEEILSSGRPEGSKKVLPYFSRTAENATEEGDATLRMRPYRASRNQLHRDRVPRRDLRSTHTFLFPNIEATVLLEEVEAFMALPKTKRRDEHKICYTVEPINPTLILGEFMMDPGDVYTMISPQHVHLVPLSKWVSHCKIKCGNYKEIAKAVAICLCGVVLFPSGDHLVDYSSLSAINGVWWGLSLSHAVLAYLYAGLSSAAMGGPLYGSMILLECWLGVRIKFKPAENPTTESRIFGCHPLCFIGGAAKFPDRVICRTADKKTWSAWRHYLNTLPVEHFTLDIAALRRVDIRLPLGGGLDLQLVGNMAMVLYNP
ncbi:hypothetical protein Taro_022500 [Colocasia esculenta]|uniref:Retrotransposon gag domain-containing protein n=1 Tax=Colocasia esculenta TaxID=4460 RepID=A0A843V1R1_COLES|nr:hypothetical protein [Colocasia esculenta]